MIDGPELASDVAKLEGLSGDWQGLGYEEIMRYMQEKDPVLRDKSAWHLHNAFSELEAENKYRGQVTDTRMTTTPEILESHDNAIGKSTQGLDL